MKLNVFPRGQVTSPGRVIVRNSRQHAKLRRLQHTRCDLHSQHLEARLPLAISAVFQAERAKLLRGEDRKSTRLNSSHSQISYAVFCLKKKKHSGLECHSGSIEPNLSSD